MRRTRAAGHRRAARPSTSAASSAAVPSPQSYVQLGQLARARCAPIASPTEVSSALETTTGRPALARTIRSAAPMPPSGCALITSRSAAPARATASGSLGLAHALVRRDRDAHVPACGAAARPAPRRVAHGCSTYSRSYAAQGVDRALRLVDVPARRSRRRGCGPPGRGASRTAAHPGHVVREGLAGLGHLHLDGAAAGEAVQHPGDLLRRRRRARSRSPGSRSRSGAGAALQPKSIAAASQRGGLGIRRTRGTARTRSSPAGPRSSIASRTSMPRKRVARGSATDPGALEQLRLTGWQLWWHASSVPCRCVAALGTDALLWVALARRSAWDTGEERDRRRTKRNPSTAWPTDGPPPVPHRAGRLCRCRLGVRGAGPRGAVRGRRCGRRLVARRGLASRHCARPGDDGGHLVSLALASSRRRSDAAAGVPSPLRCSACSPTRWC